MQTCWWIDEAAGAEMQPARHSYRCSRIHALYHVVSVRRLSESGCDSEMTEQRTGSAVLPDGCPSLSPSDCTNAQHISTPAVRHLPHWRHRTRVLGAHDNIGNHPKAVWRVSERSTSYTHETI